MRHTNQKRLEAIWRTVEETPGIRAGQVARDLDLHRTTVMRALPAMEEEGLLLSEDDQGRLWSWRRRA